MKKTIITVFALMVIFGLQFKAPWPRRGVGLDLR